MAIEKIEGYWFSASDRLPHGDGRKVVIGKTHSMRGEIIICQHGFHASRQSWDALKFAPKETVNPFNKIGTVLIRLVYPSLQGQGFNWINSWVSDDIFQMPLNCINPIFQIQITFNGIRCVRILFGGGMEKHLRPAEHERQHHEPV